MWSIFSCARCYYCEFLLSSFADLTKPELAGMVLKQLAHWELLRDVQSSIVMANPADVPGTLQWRGAVRSCGLSTNWSLSSTGNEVWLHPAMWAGPRHALGFPGTS